MGATVFYFEVVAPDDATVFVSETGNRPMIAPGDARRGRRERAGFRPFGADAVGWLWLGAFSSDAGRGGPSG
jgi:hypothetical protein